MTFGVDQDPRNANQPGGSEHVHLRITVSVLADLFGVHKETVRRWIRNKTLNPCNLREILDYYQERTDRLNKGVPPK